MKKHLPFLVALLTFTRTSLAAAADDAAGAGPAHSLGRSLLYMLIFAACGIVIAIAGYKLFDRFTPGDLHKEIVEKQNVAAAIVAGAIVLGICIIVAAAMVG